MKLLIITQKVDSADPILGFFHQWVEEFAKHCEFGHCDLFAKRGVRFAQKRVRISWERESQKSEKINIHFYFFQIYLARAQKITTNHICAYEPDICWPLAG